MSEKKSTCTYEEAFGDSYLGKNTGEVIFPPPVKKAGPGLTDFMEYDGMPKMDTKTFEALLKEVWGKNDQISEDSVQNFDDVMRIMGEVDDSFTQKYKLSYEEFLEKYGYLSQSGLTAIKEAIVHNEELKGNIKHYPLTPQEMVNRNTVDKKNDTIMHKGLRYNSNKLRYDLLHPKAIEGLVKVLTKGAVKYEPRNWELGMEWSSVIQSLERHLAAMKAGEDFDPETGELHIDHLQCNAHFLSAYYHIYPKGDNRDVWYKKPLKNVYLDIDGILADFEKYFLSYLKLPAHHPTDWNDYRFRDNFSKIANDNRFWIDIPRIFDPKEFDYPIKGYVTARPVGNEVTKKWLDLNGFPEGELVNVGTGVSKVDALKGKCDVFVDDSIYNFMELQSAGITCFLMTRPHNQKYNVGNMRVNNIREFLQRVKSL